MTASAERCAAHTATTDPSGLTVTAGEVAVAPFGETAVAADHFAAGVRTLVRTWPLDVQATTAVPAAWPAVTSAGDGLPLTVASVNGVDQVADAFAATGAVTLAATMLAASMTPARQRRDLADLDSLVFMS